MQVELIPVDGANRAEAVRLGVLPYQQKYIASNERSLQQADESGGIARPFVIKAEGRTVGFAMLAFDEGYDDPDDRYWLWRFMIDEHEQGKGYGRLALEAVMQYFADKDVKCVRLSTKPDNEAALALYSRFGFYNTGKMNGEEIVLEFKK